jgi:hypothetical protein
MRKTIAVLATLGVVMFGFASASSAAVFATWGVAADAAIAQFAVLDDGNQGVFAYANMFEAVGLRSGWNSTQAQAYLTKVLSLQKPGGGYGLPDAFDAFGDTTVNAATTQYTITMADHVGSVFLDAYEAGAPGVTAQMITDLGAEILAVPVVSTVGGHCMAYSDNPNDKQPTYCVHNINAAVLTYLQRARALGVPITGGEYRSVQILKREVGSIIVPGYNWLYCDCKPAINDQDHNSINVEAMVRWAPTIGRSALSYHMANALDATSALAHIRLGSLPDGCPKVDPWVGEFNTWYAANAANPIRVAQAAKWTALIAARC